MTGNGGLYMGAGNGGPVMEVNKAAGRSLRMTAGDIIILTGVSGVGKSTLINILQPDLKAVMVFERDWLGFMVMRVKATH